MIYAAAAFVMLAGMGLVSTVLLLFGCATHATQQAEDEDVQGW